MMLSTSTDFDGKAGMSPRFGLVSLSHRDVDPRFCGFGHHNGTALAQPDSLAIYATENQLSAGLPVWTACESTRNAAKKKRAVGEI
jgi:hypothetical protein